MLHHETFKVIVSLLKEGVHLEALKLACQDVVVNASGAVLGRLIDELQV
jgi:hypothetical protein